MVKAYNDVLTEATPIRLLNSIRIAPRDDSLTVFWNEEFDGQSYRSPWSAATVGGSALPVPTVLDATSTIGTEGVVKAATTTEVGLYRELTTVDTTQAYQIWMTPWPTGGTGNFSGTSTYKMFALMQDGNADPEQDGIVITLILDGNTTPGKIVVDGSLKSYKAGVLQGTTTFAQQSPLASIYQLKVDIDVPNKRVLPNFGYDLAGGWIDLTAGGHSLDWTGVVGNAMGFSLVGSGNNDAYLARFVAYYPESVAQVGIERDMLVAVCGGDIYRSLSAGTIAQNANVNRFATDVPLHGAERNSKLYIADYSKEPLASASDGVASSTATFDSATYSDWTTLGISNEDHGLAIHNGTNAGFYRISVIDTNTLTVTPDWPGAATGMRFTIERIAKVFDGVSDDIKPLTVGTDPVSGDPLGQVPIGASLIALYRDRIVLSGRKQDRHELYMSRAGDPTDWNYEADATDLERAVATANGIQAGRISEPISALIVHSDDYMLIGCRTSIYRMVGDPAAGGDVYNLSRRIGILSQGAWCHDPNNTVIFLSKDGIYQVVAGGNSYPIQISRDKLPRELASINEDNVDIAMIYDVKFRGVHIFLTPSDGVAGVHWWFDVATGAFWKDIYNKDNQPTSVLDFYGDTVGERGTIFGCRDGYLRNFSAAAGYDDQDTFASSVYIGPIMLGNSQYEDGMMLELLGILDEQSGSVTWELFKGDNPESAYQSATAFDSGTWTAGSNYSVHPRCFAHDVFIKISGVNDYTAWALEAVRIRTVGAGRQKLL